MLLVVLTTVLALPIEGPMSLLQIYRDPLTPGREAEYDAVERDAARICARLGFPNPHLALESLTGPREVWWLNAFASEDHRKQVARDFEANTELVKGLEGITKRREGLVGPPLDHVARHRPDLGGTTWNPAGARFFVVTVSRSPAAGTATVFEAPDGSSYAFTPARTRDQADAEARARGADAVVFAVRPQWGLPAPEWIAADPEFWRASPRVVERAPDRP